MGDITGNQAALMESPNFDFKPGMRVEWIDDAGRVYEGIVVEVHIGGVTAYGPEGVVRLPNYYPSLVLTPIPVLDDPGTRGHLIEIITDLYRTPRGVAIEFFFLLAGVSVSNLVGLIVDYGVR